MNCNSQILEFVNEKKIRNCRKIMLYFAYGSNLNHFQMKRRCKDSIFKKNKFKNFRLTFRSKYRAADIEPKKEFNSTRWFI